VGFLTNGNRRLIKEDCLLSTVKAECKEYGERPKLAVCITMFNENEAEFKTTIAGLL